MGGGGGLSGYNIESLTLDHRGLHKRVPSSLHYEDIFCRFQKRV
jgi:hypothetical protein